MSDLPPAGPPPLGPAGFSTAPLPTGPWPPMMPIRRPSRWPAFSALVISIVALAFAVAAWLRPAPEPAVEAAPTYSDQQVAEAKAAVCGAYAKLRYALDSNLTRDGGDDPNLQLLVAVNDRQIYIAGSAYLLTMISNSPAVSPELGEATVKLAELYQIISLNFLASDSSVPERADADAAASAIQDQCKS